MEEFLLVRLNYVWPMNNENTKENLCPKSQRAS